MVNKSLPSLRNSFHLVTGEYCPKPVYFHSQTVRKELSGSVINMPKMLFKKPQPPPSPATLTELQILQQDTTAATEEDVSSKDKQIVAV